MIKRISKKSIEVFEKQVEFYKEKRFNSIIDEFHRTIWLNRKIKIKGKTPLQVKQILFQLLSQNFCFDEQVTKWNDLKSNYYFLESWTADLYRIETCTNYQLCYMTTGLNSLLFVKLKVRNSFFNWKNTILWYTNGFTSKNPITYWNLNGTINKYRAKKSFMERSMIFKKNIKEIIEKENK